MQVDLLLPHVVIRKPILLAENRQQLLVERQEKRFELLIVKAKKIGRRFGRRGLLSMLFSKCLRAVVNRTS
jgi:hypothetical protein